MKMSNSQLTVKYFNLKILNVFPQYLKMYTYDGIFSGSVVQHKSLGRTENGEQPDLFSGGDLLTASN